MELLEVSHLRKTFGPIVAVEDISFTVQKGEVFTIIGPNGAGKTTTLEMVEGLQKPDQGEIRIYGMNWAQHGSQMKQVIGVQRNPVHFLICLVCMKISMYLPASIISPGR
jgi:ABC-2 type transport system ATP-binding protein